MPEMDSNGLSGLRRLFNKADLDTEKFINNVSREGGTTIIETIHNLNKMSDEASTQMKLAIYNNFQLFIDAGKAVSGLGATMHQLDHHLVEQIRLCSCLSERSLFKEAISSNGETDKSSTPSVPSSLASLLNSVEGVSNLVTDSARQLLFDGDVVEVNTSMYLKQSYAHLFILTDYVLVTKCQADSHGTPKYQKQALYEIENVAAVNVKSRDSQKTPLNLVQLLVFPDSRVFQMNSLKDKRALLSAVEEAKKLHIAGVASEDQKQAEEVNEKNRLSSMLVDNGSKHRSSNSTAPEQLIPITTTDPYNGYGRNPVVCSPEIENACLEAIAATIPDTAKFLRDKKLMGNNDNAIAYTSAGRIKNPFQQDSMMAASNGSQSQSVANEDAWLWEAPEDIDVAVAIRDFSKATQITCKARQRIVEITRVQRQSQRIVSEMLLPSSSIATPGLPNPDLPYSMKINKLAERIEQRAASLSIVLEGELIRASERHGAVGSVRTAAVHLADLGKTVLAMHLFLTYRSGVMLRMLATGVKQEGNQLVYLNRLSLIFHRCLVETVTEWGQLVNELKELSHHKNFEDLIASKLCSWVLEEIEKFSHQLKIVLLDSRSISFYAMASASKRIHAHSTRVTELIGIDVRSALDNCLLKSWQHAAEEQSRVYQDALEHRVSKEIWQKASAYKKIDVEANLKIMSEAGFPEIRQSLSEGQQLTAFTMHSSRSLSYFCRACARFDCSDELGNCFATCLSAMLQKELDVYSRAINEAPPGGDNSLIIVNLQFFVNKVIPKIVKCLLCEEHPAIMTVITSFKKLLRTSQ